MNIGNGDNKGNGPGNDFRATMKKAIETEQTKTLATKLGALLGTVGGFLFGTFFLPFVIVYAYNGLQPAVWPDISYLPAVAGLFVFRTLVHLVRSE